MGLWPPVWFFFRLRNFLHFLRLQISNNFCFLNTVCRKLFSVKFLKMFISLALCYWSDRFRSFIAILHLYTRLDICKYLYWNVVLEKDGDQVDRSWREGVKEERNILHTHTHTHTHKKRRKASYIGHILPRSNCLKGVIEGNIEVTGRRGWRQKQLLDDLKQSRRYWRFKEETLSAEVALEGAMDLS